MSAARRTLNDWSQRYGREPSWGCSRIAHQTFGYCRHCPGEPPELAAWRLLAIARADEKDNA